jgi:hypothetical protein
MKALQHDGIAAGRRAVIGWVDATALEPAADKADAEADEKRTRCKSPKGAGRTKG